MTLGVMTIGAIPTEGGCRFTVWAPVAERVDLVFDEGGPAGSVAMERAECGYWTVSVEGVGDGVGYRFSLDGDEPRPDPASRHQPWGVHGPSAVVDPSRFEWTDGAWTGRSLADCVFYELHVGTFTAEGTFEAAAGQLPRLAELGVTMVELMPVNAFPGARNWGYDGVFPSAVQTSYGGPRGLAAFVDAAHGLEMGVTLDVVYNHLGPEGNVLGSYGPYVTDRFATPWGPALNFSEPGSDEVRRYFIESATQWVTDYHVDGLRLDAVHAILDPTALTFLEELVTTVRAAATTAGRQVLVVAESSDNDPRLVRPPALGGIGCDAVWNDDFHHALRVTLTGDTTGYYGDYTAGPADLAQAYEHGFILRGRRSVVRGRRHGRPADGVDPGRMVVFGQNHDQVGNRQEGDRPDRHLSPAQRRLAAAAVLLSPCTPLLFMGEEYGEVAPFPFFVDHGDPELLQAVRDGRAAEFASFAWEGETPDPVSPGTFRAAVLDPTLRLQPPHRELETLYRDLLALRRQWPVLSGTDGWPTVEQDGGLITLAYDGDPPLRVLFNFSAVLQPVPPSWSPVFSTVVDVHQPLAAWSAAVFTL